MGAVPTTPARSPQQDPGLQLGSEQKRQAALTALAQFQREKRIITKAAVARQAGVSLVFLRSHPDLVQAVEEAASTRSALVSSISPVHRRRTR